MRTAAMLGFVLALIVPGVGFSQPVTVPILLNGQPNLAIVDANDNDSIGDAGDCIFRAATEAGPATSHGIVEVVATSTVAGGPTGLDFCVPATCTAPAGKIGDPCFFDFDCDSSPGQGDGDCSSVPAEVVDGGLTSSLASFILTDPDNGAVQTDDPLRIRTIRLFVEDFAGSCVAGDPDLIGSMCVAHAGCDGDDGGGVCAFSTAPGVCSVPFGSCSEGDVGDPCRNDVDCDVSPGDGVCNPQIGLCDTANLVPCMAEMDCDGAPCRFSGPIRFPCREDADCTSSPVGLDLGTCEPFSRLFSGAELCNAGGPALLVQVLPGFSFLLGLEPVPSSGTPSYYCVPDVPFGSGDFAVYDVCLPVDAGSEATFSFATNPTSAVARIRLRGLPDCGAGPLAAPALSRWSLAAGAIALLCLGVWALGRRRGFSLPMP
jgi:hypothetical protein